MSATVVLDAQSHPISVGTVVANPLPAGCTAVTISDANFLAVLAGDKRVTDGGVLVDTSRAQIAANLATLQTRAAAALTANATFMAIASPSNAQTLAQVRTLTKECNALIRLALNLLDDISDT